MPRPILFAFFIVTLDAMGAGLVFPVLPQLLSQVFSGQMGEEIAPDSNLVTNYGGMLSFVFAAMMFLFGPIIGSLSDRYGRQRIILFAMVALVVDYIIMALTPFFWVLFVGRIVAGIAGGSYTTAFAIAADVGDEKTRPGYFGFISAGLGLGFIIGPMIGGFVGELDPRLPFWIAAGLAAFAAVLCVTFYQETLGEDARRAFSWAESNALSIINKVRRNTAIRAFLIAIFFFSVGETVYETIWHFYGTKAFGWTPLDISYSLVAFGAGMAAVQGGLSGPLINRFGALPTSITAMALSCVGLAAMTFVQATWQVYVLMPLMWVSGLSLPGIQTYLSERTDETRQGELQGILASIGAAALILAPVYGTRALALATPDDGSFFFPGAPFGVACLICLVALYLMRRAAKNSKNLSSA